MIISGHRKPKDRAIIINGDGKIILDRAKYDPFMVVEEEGFTLGHILCDELVLQDLSSMQNSRIHLTVHPIGVGMFSEEQFDEWTAKAKEIARKYHTVIIGTSHADGSFKGADISIPIAYCIDENGQGIFISKNDTRTRMMNLETRLVTIT